MSEHSIHADQRTHDGVDPIEAHADRFFAETPKGVYRKQREDLTKTSGTFVPDKWIERWDLSTAAYLSHFVHYLGTQKRNDGYVWDSVEAVEKKLKQSVRQQKRIRDTLERDGAIHAKRGPGNTWMIRPNLPLLILFDGMPSWDEAVEKVMKDLEQTSQPERVEKVEKSLRNVITGGAESASLSLQKRVTVMQKARHSHAESASLNTETPETLSNSGALAQPEPEREERMEEKNKGKVERCVEFLSDIEGIGNARFLSGLVETLIKDFPEVPALDACRRYRDKVAAKAAQGDPVRRHAKYVRGHFQEEARIIENETPHPHGADAPVFRASEQEADSGPRIDPRKLARLMAQGVPDEEAVERATVGDEERTVA